MIPSYSILFTARCVSACKKTPVAQGTAGVVFVMLQSAYWGLRYSL